ncbi:MAG: cbf2 [Verrucomicrobiales bacterium]|nr:cbf2 [Verrucomicrobiales bacterium]
MFTINGEVIPDDLLEQEFETIKAHYERMGAMSCCGRDGEFREYARENVTARVLINQEAERRFPDISEEEVDAAVQRLIDHEGGRAAFFAHAGLTEEDEPMVRQEVAAGLRVDRLMSEVWGVENSPDSDAGARAAAAEQAERLFYANHLTDYMSPEEVRALHLFKQVEKVEDRDSCYELMRGLRRQARAGGDFGELALANTDKEDKQVDLGFFRRGEFMEEFDLIVFSLEEGEVSPVFASHWGFHLVKLVERRSPGPLGLEAVREDVRQRLETEHRSVTTRALVDRLKAAAEIL